MLSLLRPKFSNKTYHLSVDGANKLVLKVGLSIFDKITRVRDLSSENNFTNNYGDTQNSHGHLLRYVITLNLLHCPNFLTCINSFQ